MCSIKEIFHKIKKMILILLSIVILLCYVLPIQVMAFGPSNNTIYQGIDVSGYQRNIDFKKVKTPAITKIITNNVTAIESNVNSFINNPLLFFYWNPVIYNFRFLSYFHWIIWKFRIFVCPLSPTDLKVFVMKLNNGSHLLIIIINL